MTLLAIKALLAPTFVVGASLAARRYGPRVGGLVGGLPVVAGPILLVYALEHGRSFAGHAAGGTLLGLVSLTGFVVVYGRLAGRARWPAAMLAGWGAFAVGTLLFSALTVPAGLALALACAGFALGLALLPRPAGEPRTPAPPPAWDLPLRAGCALALVAALTTAAGWLGPQLSGLLAPFPVITTVLATFTHAQRGAQDTVRLLRGMLTGFVAFALFCFTLAVSLRTLGAAAGFALATAVALLTQGVLIARAGREPGGIAAYAQRGPAGVTSHAIDPTAIAAVGAARAGDS
ncbi:MAG TPA: hypothetical protein VNY52_04410 [Solirubrobacteraceae bacterium]|jgi:hypothetical protein|nr:hypothetical protein [Solirubrobacteraceae bacterium]